MIIENPNDTKIFFHGLQVIGHQVEEVGVEVEVTPEIMRILLMTSLLALLHLFY
jgi:hypothetical protein